MDSSLCLWGECEHTRLPEEGLDDQGGSNGEAHMLEVSACIEDVRRSLRKLYKALKHISGHSKRKGTEDPLEELESSQTSQAVKHWTRWCPEWPEAS